MITLQSIIDIIISQAWCRQILIDVPFYLLLFASTVRIMN